MKLIGISMKHAQTVTNVVLATHGLLDGSILWVGTNESCYVKVAKLQHGVSAASKFGSTHNGAGHYSPCACFFKAFRDALTGSTDVPWSFWLHKHKIHQWSSNGKIHVTMAQFACAHDGAPASVEHAPAGSAVAALAPTPVKVPTGKLAAIEPLASAALTDGETTDLSAVKLSRGVFPASCSMYVLAELRAAASCGGYPKMSSMVADHKLRDYMGALTWARQLRATHDGFAARLARNFFDYLVLASFGEALHGNGSKYTLGDTVLPHGACNSHPDALRYDPRSMIPALEWCFSAHSWGDSYGGPRWAKIVHATGLYYKFGVTAPMVFADHCVDLKHNGGLTFNKGYILKNPSDEVGYMKMLDTKRNGSLLGSRLKLEVTEEVYRLVITASTLNIIPPYHAALEIKPDVVVPTIKWGTATLPVYHGAHAPIAAHPHAQSEVTHDGPPDTLTAR